MHFTSALVPSVLALCVIAFDFAVQRIALDAYMSLSVHARVVYPSSHRTAATRNETDTCWFACGKSFWGVCGAEIWSSMGCAA
eukprot:994301-Rhodomonas_salina.2